MGEYEPRDSRKITLSRQRAPGEPPRTGPREGETRQPEQDQAAQELTDDDASDAELREQAIEQDADELDAAVREGPERFDRND